jgi:hypothetical protein
VKGEDSRIEPKRCAGVRKTHSQPPTSGSTSQVSSEVCIFTTADSGKLGDDGHVENFSACCCRIERKGGERGRTVGLGNRCQGRDSEVRLPRFLKGMRKSNEPK